MLKTSWERARTLLFGDRRRGVVTVTAAILAAGAVGLPALASGPASTTTAQVPAAVSANPLPSDYFSPSPAVTSAAPTPSATKASPTKPATPKATAKATAKATTKATSSAKAATVLREVAKLAGSPYVFGATGPDTFDCAGLTQYVYAKIGIKLVNYVPTQLDTAKAVSHSQQRPGDLIFFMSGDFAYHVGIYAGHHKMWDAPTEGQTVGLHEIWDDSYLVGQFF